MKTKEEYEQYLRRIQKSTAIENAQLKAVNAELLEALQNICDACDGNNPEHAIFYFTSKAAITKAISP